jgi:hypothetical protein
VLKQSNLQSSSEKFGFGDDMGKSNEYRDNGQNVSLREWREVVSPWKTLQKLIVSMHPYNNLLTKSKWKQRLWNNRISKHI